MEPIELQKQFFGYIKERLPSHISLVDELADLLGISNDSAYRRIRGEKLITFDETRAICLRFRVSLDHLFDLTSDSTVFAGGFVSKENFNYSQYLEDMLRQLETIEAAKDKVLYYEAKDIPLFHHFQLPELASFKYYFWMRTILGYDDFQKMEYEAHDMMEPIHALGQRIIKAYIRIPSIEIWSVETINSTLRQIEYYRQAGVFKKKRTVELIYDDLEKLIDHLQLEAEAGEKFLVGGQPTGDGTNYKLFVNEVIMGHNTLLAVMDESMTTFINHSIINYMITRNLRFCSNTKKSLDNLINKSSLISGINEKERSRFFRMMKDKIVRYRQMLWTQAI